MFHPGQSMSFQEGFVQMHFCLGYGHHGEPRPGSHVVGPRGGRVLAPALATVVTPGCSLRRSWSPGLRPICTRGSTRCCCLRSHHLFCDVAVTPSLAAWGRLRHGGCQRLRAPGRGADRAAPPGGGAGSAAGAAPSPAVGPSGGAVAFLRTDLSLCYRPWSFARLPTQFGQRSLCGGHSDLKPFHPQSSQQKGTGHPKKGAQMEGCNPTGVRPGLDSLTFQ